MENWQIKIKAIIAILSHQGVGIVLFKHIPTEGDTITVGNMFATFKKITDWKVYPIKLKDEFMPREDDEK